MPQQPGAQGAKPPVPPIPKMDAPVGRAQTADRASELKQATDEFVLRAVQDARAVQDRLGADGRPALVIPPQRGGTPGTSSEPEFINLPTDIPPRAMEVLQMFFTFIVVLALGTPLVRALVRRFDRKTTAIRTAGPDMTPQLRQLQESIDTMAIELERISEGQRFTSKLLAERADRVPVVERQGQG